MTPHFFVLTGPYTHTCANMCVVCVKKVHRVLKESERERGSFPLFRARIQFGFRVFIYNSRRTFFRSDKGRCSSREGCDVGKLFFFTRSLVCRLFRARISCLGQYFHFVPQAFYKRKGSNPLCAPLFVHIITCFAKKTGEKKYIYI